MRMRAGGGGTALLRGKPAWLLPGACFSLLLWWALIPTARSTVTMQCQCPISSPRGDLYTCLAPPPPTRQRQAVQGVLMGTHVAGVRWIPPGRPALRLAGGCEPFLIPPS
jgi:hypothetical protein